MTKAIGKTFSTRTYNSKNKPDKYIITIETEKGDTTTFRCKTKPEVIDIIMQHTEKNQNSVISWREKP